eukprot:7770537-Karenia_brevis.AAC.1
MVGNSKFWHILKTEPFIFPTARWVDAIHQFGAEVFTSSALDDEDPEKTNLMFLPVYAKRVVDQTRQLWKVKRGKTPGSSGWMKDTDTFVAKFEDWWFTV